MIEFTSLISLLVRLSYPELHWIPEGVLELCPSKSEPSPERSGEGRRLASQPFMGTWIALLDFHTILDLSSKYWYKFVSFQSGSSP